MGLQSAMTTALTGLQAAETTIDVVGNNVANSNTIGFKESNAVFATQFLQTQSIGSAPSDARGGTNPRQIGLGTKVAAINPDFTQGTIEISANPLDVAIQGDGFLMVQGSQGERLYTRNGQLQTNANNEVVTITGNRVLGYGVNDEFVITPPLRPLQIPLGEEIVAQATERAVFSGVLTPEATVATTPRIIASEVLGSATLEVPTDPDFDLDKFTVMTPPTVSATTAAQAAGSLAAGDYSYRVVFYAETGPGSTVFESAPSTSFGNTTVAANEDVAITGLPTDSSGLWAGRRLYRSMDGGDFELVADLDTTTANYTDNVAAPIGPALNDDSLDTANYSYYITYFDTTSGTESRPTARIGSMAISDLNRRIRIDDIPQPASADFNGVRIYRNIKGNSGEFYRVAELTNGETSFIDNVPDADIITEPQIDLVGPKADVGTRLVDVVVRNGQNYSTPFEEGVLTFTGQRGERDLAGKQFTITATTTVGNLMEFMDEAMGIDNSLGGAGSEIDAGVMRFTSNLGVENALDIGLSAFLLQPTGSTTSAPISIEFDTEPGNVVDGEGSTSDFLVFDSLGIPVNVRLTTAMESQDGDTTVYRWYATSDDNQPSAGADTLLGTGTITFNGAGQIVSGGTATVAVQREQTPSDLLEFDLDFTQVSGLAVSNNLGVSASSMSMTQQDGFPPGSLTSFIITESGLIRGVFSNGTERPLGQIKMARFANSAGLQQVGENVFTQGVNSGEPIVGDPGEGGIGTITAGAVELSNTDIGQNLIELILASTQYRGGTRVITAAQQMLDELMALRR